MTATAEEAIQGFKARLKQKIHPSNSSLFNNGLKTKIRILEQTPRDLPRVQRIIDQKKAMLKQSTNPIQGDILDQELFALEWLRMILKGSDREREIWANVSKLRI